MNFGLFMMPLHPPKRSFADSYDRDIELIVQANRLGYHEAWVGEHITEIWENAPVPELLIAKALALTSRIVLATGVTMLPLHHPVDTAHRIAMLDHMARGRFYWGIGVKSIPTDLQLYRVQSDDMQAVRDQGERPLTLSWDYGPPRTAILTSKASSMGSMHRMLPQSWTAGYITCPTRSPIHPSAWQPLPQRAIPFAWPESGAGSQ